MSGLDPKYLAIGIAVGAAVGVATDNIGLWLAVGVAIGAALSVTLNRTDDADKGED